MGRVWSRATAGRTSERGGEKRLGENWFWILWGASFQARYIPSSHWHGCDVRTMPSLANPAHELSLRTGAPINFWKWISLILETQYEANQQERRAFSNISNTRGKNAQRCRISCDFHMGEYEFEIDFRVKSLVHYVSQGRGWRVYYT